MPVTWMLVFVFSPLLHVILFSLISCILSSTLSLCKLDYTDIGILAILSYCLSSDQHCHDCIQILYSKLTFF